MKKVIILFFIPLNIIKQNRGTNGSGRQFVCDVAQSADRYYVVSRNIAALDTLYARDFVFNHGSGRVEGKAGWLKTVARANYPVRQHDSVRIELHPSLAIVKGKMFIQKGK